MTTTLKIKKDTLNALKEIKGKTNNDKILTLIDGIQTVYPNGILGIPTTDSETLYKWFKRIESAIRAQELEIKSIRELINTHIN